MITLWRRKQWDETSHLGKGWGNPSRLRIYATERWRREKEFVRAAKWREVASDYERELISEVVGNQLRKHRAGGSEGEKHLARWRVNRSGMREREGGREGDMRRAWGVIEQAAGERNDSKKGGFCFSSSVRRIKGGEMRQLEIELQHRKHMTRCY
jgi:hypothetical protein